MCLNNVVMMYRPAWEYSRRGDFVLRLLFFDRTTKASPFVGVAPVFLPDLARDPEGRLDTQGMFFEKFSGGLNHCKCLFVRYFPPRKTRNGFGPSSGDFSLDTIGLMR